MAELVTESKLTYLRSPRAGRLAVLTLDNGQDHTKPNTLGAGGLASLAAALDELARQDDVKGLLVTGKPFIFVVGADVTAFSGVDQGLARAGSRRGHEVFGRLRALPFPTVAAINGVCMGGGLELALSCEARTLSEGAQAVAFPEVFLSIVPGWGGTQLASRLVGAANALKAIVENPLNQNRTLRPHQAFELGLADRLLPALDFFEASLGFLEDLVSGAATVRRTPPPAEGLDELFAGARRMVEERVHGATQAPGAAIDLVEFAARGGDLEEGLEREADALGRLLAARQAQAAVYAFGLTQQRVKRQPGRPQVPPREVRKVGIVGAGLMGRQLGSLYLQRMEVPLVLVDLDEQVLAQAREAIEGELTKRVQRGRLTEGRARFLGSLVQTTTDYDALTGSDLVVEAVVEVLDVKRRIFADAEAVTDPGCVFATNTSSLSVAAIAEGLQHPERVVGLHFFNPVAVLPLVEVVRGDHTSDEALATAFEVGKRLGKSAVACADTPAFVVNRLLTRFMSAAGEAVRRGNRFTEVDDAVKALGLPMGPFELLGLVGPEVNAHVVETLHEAFPDRFPIDENMTWLARSGLPGVYDWARGRVPYEEVAQRWQRVEGGGLPEGEIRTLALEAVADEARRMLDEGVVPDARDIDTCMLLGAGFPFFNGGICKYLDQTGVSEKLFGATLLTAEDRAFAR